MSRRWQSSFDSGGTNQATAELLTAGSTGFSFSSTVVRSGVTSGKFTNPAGGNPIVTSPSGFNLASSYFRVYFRLEAAPSALMSIIQLLGPSSAGIVRISLSSSRTLQLLNMVDASAIGPASAALALDTWYRLEIQLTVGAGTGSAEFRIDGETIGSGTSLDLGSANLDYIRFMESDSGDATYYLEDAALNDTNGSSQNSWPGAGNSAQFAPNGDGTLNSWGSEGTSPHYDSADDWPGVADDDSTYLLAPNKTDAAAFFDLVATPSDFNPAAINAIMALVRVRKEEAGGGAGDFPTIPTVAGGRVLSTTQADASGTRTFPSLSSLTKNAGDLLVAIILAYQSSTTDAQFSAWGGGFTEIHDTGSSSTMAIGVAYKWSTGSETGTFTVTQAATVTGHAAMFLLSIPGAHASTPPEVGSRASGTTSAADPAAFNPAGWDAENTLWISVGGSGETASGGAFAGLSSAPANYGNYVDTGISGDVVGGVEGAVAFRQNNTASEDVGAFGVDVSNARSAAVVIAVRPATNPVDTVDLYAQLVRSDESTAITTEATIVAAAPTSYTTYLILLPTTGTHSKTDWDAARLMLRQDYTQQGLADTTARLRVTAVALLVDYIPAVFISPGALASAEAVGSPTLVVSAKILPTALATAESVQAARLNQQLVPAALATAESVQAAQLNQQVSPAALDTGEAIPAPLLHHGVTATGLATEEALGSPTVAEVAEQTLYPDGLASGETLGSLTMGLVVQPTEEGVLGLDGAHVFDDVDEWGRSVLRWADGVALLDTGLPIGVGRGGVPSREMFGLPAVTQALSIVTEAITSAEALGSPTLVLALYLVPEGLVTAEALGSPILAQRLFPSGLLTEEIVSAARLNQQVFLSGLVSAEAFGVMTMKTGWIIVAPGLDSLEAFGSPTVVQALAIIADGLPTVEVVGSPTLTAGWKIFPTGLGSAEVFGALSVKTGWNIVPTALASLEALGSPGLTVHRVIAPTGVAALEVIGSPTLVAGWKIFPEGLVSAEAIGYPGVAGQGFIVPTGIASLEALGSPGLVTSVKILPAGLVSSEGLGTVVLAFRLVPVGIAPDQAFGVPTFRTGVRIILPGIASQAALGALQVNARLFPVGVPSGEQLGAFTLAQRVFPGGVPTSQGFGTLTLAETLRLLGIGTAEGLGTPQTLAYGPRLYLIGIPSQEAFGALTLSGGTFALFVPTLYSIGPSHLSTRRRVAARTEVIQRRTE